MDTEIRPVTQQEYDAWIKAKTRGFGEAVSEEHMRKIPFEPERSLAAFDRGKIVGTAYIHRFEVRVPGGWLPLAGVAGVTVQPTHRRRGILTRMMAAQLQDIHEQGEPLAGLYASESIIYGRYGYGMATFHQRWSLARDRSGMEFPHACEGEVELVEADEARELFPDVYERARPLRPGMIRRDHIRWDLVLGDPEHDRRGASPYFHAVYRCDEGIDGYVLYRLNHSTQTLTVHELISATDEAGSVLWEYCFGVDLMTSTEALLRPVDEPLLWKLADPRHLKRSSSDDLWVRLVDLPSALSRRSYAGEGSLIVEVTDSYCPWNQGRFELLATSDEAECRPTSASADLSLSVADLGAVYLGGVSFRTLSHAGRVRANSPDAIQRADTLFATESQPWCTVEF